MKIFRKVRRLPAEFTFVAYPVCLRQNSFLIFDVLIVFQVFFLQDVIKAGFHRLWLISFTESSNS